MVQYTEQEKEALIDSMLSIIKGHLMKCDVNDLTINSDENICTLLRSVSNAETIKAPTGEYTYHINFKYRD